ncbi:MAG: hypothetical protein CBC55_03835 [Gammaproteobacteria bacterium TMED95]|nr:MAG: hypothetical protein CBC55_03835 [Gammaproteobacteria bacterium TMED95]|tara:strand:- start:2779 stop:2964 length:186 start_codon:yes stop_codon:yes gene_type:complete
MDFKKSKDEKGNTIFLLIEGEHGLVMTREEAEELFLLVGHVLQDDDVERYGGETGDGTEQP